MPRKSYRKRSIRGHGDYSVDVPYLGKYSYKGDTPFASVGKVIGSKFGWGQTGEGIGHAIGRLFGSGDYKMGSTPGNNSLWNTTATPKFASSGRTNTITNREYLGDLFSSTGFNNNVLTVNAGIAQTFPWLSTIAQNYEQYRISGIIFEFKSTSGDSVGSTNTSLGTVIMATEYNVNTAPYLNKQQMENSEFCQSAKASESQIHGLECARKERPTTNYFTRTGNIPVNDSLKWYDFAKFQIATTGFQQANVNIGEIWVSYNIEFLKPQIPSQIGGSVPSAVLKLSGVSQPAPLGTGVISNQGTISVTVLDPTQIVFNNLNVGTVYCFQYDVQGTAAFVHTNAWSVSTPGFSAPTAAPVNLAIWNGASTYQYPAAGETASFTGFKVLLQANATVGTINFNAGTLPAAAVFCTVVMSAVDLTCFAI